MNAVASAPPAAPAPLAAPRPRVLVCEDSATTRAFIRSLLEADHDLLLTVTAEEALERAPAFAPDVILSDLILPGMSGSSFCRAIRGVPALAGVPFVLVTTLADADARADGLEAGADDYLVKPIRERELRARVASLVRLRRVLGALEARTHELERVNAALEETQEELVAAERRAAVGALATGLIQELTNPLAYLKAGAAALDRALAEVRAAADGLLAAVPAGDPRRGAVGRSLSEAAEVAAAVSEGSRRLERLASDLRVVSLPDRADEERVARVDALGSARARRGR